jgi:prepilin-type N-terminal cleavage/methylation domain-containing protein
VPPPPTADRSRSAAVRSQAGFTLIEVLVTALIVALLGTATATALITSSHAAGDERLRSQADSLSSQDLERLRGLSDAQLNGLSQHRTVTFNGTPFTIQSTSGYLDTTGANTCTSTSVAYYKITSTVTWPEGYSNRTDLKVSDESVLSRPVSGDLRVQATDQTNANLAGVTINATGTDNQSSVTDNNGCVMFAGLSSGAYTVDLSDPGYVTPDGLASPTNATATVTATGVATPNGAPFHLGLAGSVNGTFTTYNSAAFGEADAISWLGSGAAFTMSGGFQTTTPTSPATSLTTLSLFPFSVTTPTASYTNNYAVWAGRCLQQEPPAAYDRYSVTPGSVGANQTVQEPLLDVGNVTYYNGSSTATVRPTHIKLTFNSTQPSTTSCNYSWTPTLVTGAMPATGWLAYPGQPFASSATTGSTASASSNSSSPQAGTITVCADYSGYKVTSAAMNNRSFTAMNVAPTLAIRRGTNSGTC